MSEDAPPAGRRRVLLAALFASGFCGIAYEVLYARLLGDLAGDHFIVSAAILVTFLLGIALGTRIAYRLYRWLWLIEAGIGVYAVLFLLVRPGLDQLLSLPLARTMSFTVSLCVAVLFLPALLVGCSLPLFAAYLQPVLSRRAFPLTYLIYNLGAAATALLVEFFLLRQLGQTRSLLFLAFLNFAVAALLFAMRPDGERPGSRSEGIRYSWRPLAALALVGIASAVFQLWILKITSFVYGPFRESFAMVLAVVLGGIAFGSWLVRARRWRFRTFLLANLVLISALLLGFAQLVELYPWGREILGRAWLLSWKLLVLTLLAGGSATCFGAAIPALMETEDDVARESGLLLFVASLGNVAGYLLMVFVINPALPYGATLLAMLAVLALALLLDAWPSWRPLAATAALLTVSAIGLATLWNEQLLFLDHTSFHSRASLHEELRIHREATVIRKYNETFAITRIRTRDYFFINGYRSIVLGSPAEPTVGVLSALVTPRRESALVLGLGSGATAGAVAELFDEVDVVEVAPTVIEVQEAMAEHNFGLLDKPDAHIHCDDGIRFVKTTDRKYDLILNTVTSPLYFSSSKLYTVDFFQQVKRALKPDGIYTTWLDQRVGDRGLRIILTGLEQEFGACRVAELMPEYFLLACSPSSVVGTGSHGVIATPALERFFESKGLHVLRYLDFAFAAKDPFDYLAIGGEAPTSSLDLPELAFEVSASSEPDLQRFRSFLER